MGRLYACRALILILAAAPVTAVTLQQLSSDDLINQSTAIVRCRVTTSYTATRGSEVFTHYRLRVAETWKGATVTDVAFPGGAVNGLRQSVAGIPRLQEGQEYVLYLWTNPRSGMTFVTGFQQGIFQVTQDTSGQNMVQRASTSEMMLDAQGKPAIDVATRSKLQEMSSRVAFLSHGAAH
jgi:hypothetical protein